MSRGPDPNEERNDPMVPEFWELGEAVQDAVQKAGYASPTVEGIAVDIHDMLQGVDAVQHQLAPAVVAAESPEARIRAIAALRDELEHLRWHCQEAIEFLTKAEQATCSESGPGSPHPASSAP